MDNSNNAQNLTKIVIVEDNLALGEIYKIRLELLGYAVSVAHDGEEAIEIISRERPALVLLDLMIPKVAGVEVLRTMRANDWGKDVKVHIISNLNESEAPVGLRELGIDGYTVKANMLNDDIDKLVTKLLSDTAT